MANDFNPQTFETRGLQEHINASLKDAHSRIPDAKVRGPEELHRRTQGEMTG